MHSRTLHIVLLVLLLSGFACSFPGIVKTSPSLTQTPVDYAYLLVTSNPNSSATSTPFQPLAPTATYFPTPVYTSTPTITNTALPTATKIIPTNTKIPTSGQLTHSDGEVDILLLGSDARPNEGGFRTDVILWVSIRPKYGTVTLISFPRDLWVNIPGWGDERINTAQAHGFATTQQTFLSNFGIKPDHYVLTNFNGFKEIIDTLDGIDINASQNLTDACDLPQARNGICSVGPGIVHMNGVTALWYVRSRHSTSDFDRTRRAQEVILAAFQRLISLDAITKAPQLYSQLISTVNTDMSLKDLLPLLTIAPQIMDSSKIHRFAIGPAQVYDWITPAGAMVLVPIQPTCQEVINQAFSNP
jgi:polyisoprenyl-teichoic acid--peptidoglycan teichoic acid transferase